MKKTLSIVLVLAMILGLAGCGLFSNDKVVKLGDYTHEDPKDVKYDQRIVLKGSGFEKTVESIASAAAYPNTMVIDETGNVIGMYDYDETTGLAKGWMNITDGSYTAFEEGKEVDLGKPDASKLITVPGTADMYFVVYGNEGKTLTSYLYVILSDASAKDIMISSVKENFGFDLTATTDKVLSAVLDEAAIAKIFADAPLMGIEVEKEDAEGFASVLSQSYNVRKYTGDTAFKPYSGHKDPTDVDFDKKVVLVGSGEALVEAKYAKDITSQTNFIYGKNGDVVADYLYIECPSKEAADDLMASDNFYINAEKVSDTVIRVVIAGKDMEDTLTTYVGLNVMKDRSLDEYVRNSKETYFTIEAAE